MYRFEDEEFIKEEILPNFTDCFLKNERYVLLLSQFITMKERLRPSLEGHIFYKFDSFEYKIADKSPAKMERMARKRLSRTG